MFKNSLGELKGDFAFLLYYVESCSLDKTIENIYGEMEIWTSSQWM